jgi:hypothetical protein
MEPNVCLAGLFCGEMQGVKALWMARMFFVWSHIAYNRKEEVATTTTIAVR